MEVKLKVLNGPSAGKEIRLPSKKFLIGRDEGCHLRPKSDLIGRKHCAIVVEDSKVSILDMESRNGTFVNDEQVVNSRDVQPGDKLRVGQLEFAVLFSLGLGADKKPKVKDVHDAAMRTAHGGEKEMDVMGWLDDEQQNLDDTSTRYLIADTRQIMQEAAAAAESAQKAVADAAEAAEAKTEKKKEYGKLPKGPVEAAPKDTREAAAAALDKRLKRLG